MEDTGVEHPWEQQAEDDELGEGLIARRKNLNQTPLPATINGDFSNNHGGSIAVDHQEEEEDMVKHFSQQNGTKVDNDGDEEEKKDKHQRSEYSVYYDTDKGIWKCRICSWDNEGRTCFADPRWHSHRLMNVKDVYETEGTELQHEPSMVEENIIDSTATARKNGNGVHSFNGNQNGEHQKHNNSSDISLQHSDISFEELDRSSSSYINNKTEITEIEVIKDGVLDEIAEFDVETVIKKQETHDLFCPNCNSCITKRVILRKRKRRIPVSGEDTKRNKPETKVPFDSNVVSEDLSENRALNGGDRSLGDVQTSESNEYDNQKDRDVFRCLSCFSIFMPTGNGFKLFRMFGNKRSEELNQLSQEDTPAKKNWFSNIFASDHAEKLDNQGVVQSSYSGNHVLASGTTVLEEKPASGFVPSSSFHESIGREREEDRVQSATPSGDALIIDQKVAETNGNYVGPSAGTTVLVEKPASGFVPSSSFHESNGRELEEDRVHSATTSVSRDGNALIIEQQVAESNGTIDSGVDSHDQLLTPYHTEPDNKSDYPGMFVVKPPLNNVDPSENSTSPLQYDGLKLLVPPNVGSLIIDNSQMNQELDVTVQTKDPVTEDSQRTVQNNVEVPLEEPQNLNKDVSTDGRIKLLENSNVIEGIKGKDTIITIGATGSSALQQVESGTQAAEQGSCNVATGGRSVDVVKSIVYGGLIELITSLSVVSSSVGAGAATLNVLALGLANIFGGLIVISHDLWDLKNEPERGSLDDHEDRYQQLLGRRTDFPLHVAVSLLSYLMFGFLPPLVYGFSFHERDLKLLTVVAASIVCITALAAGKAYVQRPPKSYFKTITYYVMFGFMVSGVSYLFGGLIMELLEKLHLERILGTGSGLKPIMDGVTGLASY